MELLDESHRARRAAVVGALVVAGAITIKADSMETVTLVASLDIRLPRVGRMMLMRTSGQVTGPLNAESHQKSQRWL